MRTSGLLENDQCDSHENRILNRASHVLAEEFFVLVSDGLRLNVTVVVTASRNQQMGSKANWTT